MNLTGNLCALVNFYGFSDTWLFALTQEQRVQLLPHDTGQKVCVHHCSFHSGLNKQLPFQIPLNSLHFNRTTKTNRKYICDRISITDAWFAQIDNPNTNWRLWLERTILDNPRSHSSRNGLCAAFVMGRIEPDLTASDVSLLVNWFQFVNEGLLPILGLFQVDVLLWLLEKSFYALGRLRSEPCGDDGLFKFGRGSSCEAHSWQTGTAVQQEKNAFLHVKNFGHKCILHRRTRLAHTFANFLSTSISHKHPACICTRPWERSLCPANHETLQHSSLLHSKPLQNFQEKDFSKTYRWL